MATLASQSTTVGGANTGTAGQLTGVVCATQVTIGADISLPE